MRFVQSLVSLVLCLSPLITSVSAGTWPGWLPEKDALFARADETPTSGSSLATNTDTASGSSGGPSPTSNLKALTDLNTAEPTDASTESETGRSQDKATDSKKGGRKPTHTEFANDVPPGGVNIITPMTIAEPTILYKIGDDVTVAWNYSSISGTPTAIDVIASCSVASETWDVTRNMTFQPTARVVWNTKKDAKSAEKPLLTQLYTLIIKDSDVEMSAAPKPGYLATYKGFVFGLYAPKPYTPFPEWKCTGCSDGASLLDNQVVGLAVTMSIVTLSFTWFVAGLGLQ